MITTTIPRSELVFMARSELGHIREWNSFFGDNARDQQDVAGYYLKPVARMADLHGCKRPMYALKDVRAFLDGVRAAVSAAKPMPIQTARLDVDPSTSWKENLFSRDGAAVRPRKTIAGAVIVKARKYPARTTHTKH